MMLHEIWLKELADVIGDKPIRVQSRLFTPMFPALWVLEQTVGCKPELEAAAARYGLAVKMIDVEIGFQPYTEIEFSKAPRPGFGGTEAGV